MSPHAHAPLGFRVGETQHQTLMRGGVHHAACCKSNRQHTCTRTKPFASTRIHHHPRRPRPSWTPQHLGVPRLPRRRNRLLSTLRVPPGGERFPASQAGWTQRGGTSFGHSQLHRAKSLRRATTNWQRRFGGGCRSCSSTTRRCPIGPKTATTGGCVREGQRGSARPANQFLMRNGKRSMFFKAIAVPLATACNGSSATCTGSLVFWEIRLSNPLSCAPPPARKMPVL